MTRLRLSEWNDNADSCSPLSNCLLNLKANTVKPRERTAAKSIVSMVEWQSQWSQNQDQITRRLQLIEDELDKLVAAEMPSLSIVAADC